MKKYKVILLIFLLTIFGCGSKKIVSQSETKEKTDIGFTDNSTINKKVEQEKQYINTDIKERVVTFYGVRFDTIYQNGKPFIIPIYYPERKEEDRTINTDNFIWRVNTQDSIRKAVNLQFKGALETKDKKITELKESTIIYQIALLVISLIGITLLVLYIIAKVKIKSTDF